MNVSSLIMHELPFPCLSDRRSRTCGRCTRNAAGISSLPEIASVSSTKTSSARANRPAVCQTGSEDSKKTCLSPTRDGPEAATHHSLAHLLYLFIYLFTYDPRTRF